MTNDDLTIIKCKNNFLKTTIRKINCKRGSAIGIAAIMALSSVGVAAQEVALEEIVVTGIRASLQKAMDIKHDAEGVVDVITSEDIGKFPDQNLAEALQRVTGVTISRNRGEGSGVTIRGLGGGFSKTTLNGRNMVSGSGSRDFDFQILASEYVSELSVKKTVQADMIEGGIGGTINIKTIRPLDSSGTRISGSIKGGYSELSGETDPELSVSYTDQFLDNTLGVSIAATLQQRTLRQDEYSASGFGNATFTRTNDDVLEDVATPTSANFHYITTERDRQGITGAVQWRPDDTTDIVFDFLYSRLEQQEEQASLFSQIRSNRNFVDVDDVVVNGNNTVTHLGANWQTRLMDRRFEFESDVVVVGLNASKQLGSWGIVFDAYYSGGENTSDQGQAISQPNVATIYDTQAGNNVPDLIYNGGVSDPSQLTFRNFYFSKSQSESSEYAFKVDAEKTFESGFITAIKTGVRYASTENEASSSDLPYFPYGRTETDWPALADAGMGYDYNRAFPVSDFLSGVSGNFPRSWVLPNYETYYASTNAGGQPLNNYLPGSFAITEDSLAAYFMAKFQANIGLPIGGDIGVRVVNTDQESSGYGVGAVVFNPNNGYAEPADLSPLSVTRDYTEVLPNFTLYSHLNDETVVRLAVGKVLTRPNFPDLSPRVTLSGFSRTGRAGNPNLEPFTAWQYDLSFEWYFAEASSLTAALFYKNMESFVSRAVSRETFSGDVPGEAFDVNRPVNGEGASIKGLELAYQQAFSFLPSPFDGLGVIANYTYAASSTEFENQLSANTYSLEGLAENSYNLILYYDKDRFNGRLAYNFRDEFLSQAIASQNNTLITDAFGQLDMSASYELNDNISLTLEGINILDEAYKRYYDISERTANYAETGRRILLGVRATF